MPAAADKKLFTLGATVVLTVAFVGLISGTRAPDILPRGEGGTKEASSERARSYQDLRSGRNGPNAGMYDDAFQWLRSLGPSVTDPVEQTEEERLAALAIREERRAYAGAPPVVPHPIQEREPAACLACHETGSRVGGLRAPMMSHKKYTMCVQCHAPTRQEAPAVSALGSVGEYNAFAGVGQAAHGTTAWEGAPPTIPHATFMREQCGSCHGTQGAQGLRTPHPVRGSCTQCHAPSSDFDQNLPPALQRDAKASP